MVCSTFNPLTLQKYQPDPEDLCSLCGGNHGKAAMIGCKDKIHICLNCVDVLVDIKNEREDKKRSEAVRALDSWMRDGGNDSNLLIVFYVQIMPDDFVMQLHRF